MLRFVLLCALLVGLGSSAAVAAGAGPDPAGLWLTQNKRAAIEIKHCGESLCGKIVWIIADGMMFDDKNPDPALKGRAMCGIEILSDFVQNSKNDKVWESGRIYKADEGDTYTATLSVVDQNTLYLRGYIGIPLLGKTQYWTRVSTKDYPVCKPAKH